MPRDRRRDDDYDPPPRRRSRDDDDFDRPRRRDDGDDDPPRRRRREDDFDRPRRPRGDFDDRPRRPRRDDFDDYAPPPRRRRRSRGPGVGVWLGIGGGVALLIGLVVVLVITLSGGFGARVDYEKYQAIAAGDTLDSLEKKFGRAEKVNPVEALAGLEDRAGFLRGGGGFRGPLAGVDAGNWYRWKSGSVQVFVAVLDVPGAKGRPVLKMYLDSAAMRKNAGKDANDLKNLARGWEFQTIR